MLAFVSKRKKDNRRRRNYVLKERKNTMCRKKLKYENRRQQKLKKRGIDVKLMEETSLISEVFEAMDGEKRS